jgi:hypothetical protein
MVESIRKCISEEASDAHEFLYHDALGYGPTEKGFDRVMYVAVFPEHINLGFFFGASLDDPSRLLSGEGKRMRHVKVHTVDDAERKEIRKLVREAWRQGPIQVGALHQSRGRSSRVRGIA